MSIFNAPRIIAVTCVAMLIALLAGIGWSIADESVIDGLRHVATNRWGLVTLADLTVGLLFTALWIALIERNWRRTAVWVVMLFCLGNVATLVYLMRRIAVTSSLRDAVLPRPRP